MKGKATCALSELPSLYKKRLTYEVDLAFFGSFLMRFLLLSASETRVNMTGISMSGPTTVETASIGIEAKAVKAIAIASSKFLPVQWNAMMEESS